MADEEKGTDLVNGRVELAEGLVLEDRLRLGTVLYLEGKFTKPLTEIFEQLAIENPRFTDMAIILTGLYMQTHPDATEHEAEKAIGRLDLTEVSGAFAKLKFADFEPKNSETPDAPATPQADG